MLPLRIIARLDIKGSRLIKGIHLEGWRFLGDPNEFCRRYYQAGVDEIIYLDAVASLYNREILKNIVADTTKEVFIPITAGGGGRTINDAYELLRVGADKVAINTAAVKNPGLITEIANKFGKQCVVVSIEAKKIQDKKWEAYIDNGRQPTGLDVLVWVQEVEKRGAGEILLTSVDRDGTGKGFDLDLAQAVTKRVSVPVIASGGINQAQDLVRVVTEGGVGAVAIGKAFHYGQLSVAELHQAARQSNIIIRRI